MKRFCWVQRMADHAQPASAFEFLDASPVPSAPPLALVLDGDGDGDGDGGGGEHESEPEAEVLAAVDDGEAAAAAAEDAAAPSGKIGKSFGGRLSFGGGITSITSALRRNSASVPENDERNGRGGGMT